MRDQERERSYSRAVASLWDRLIAWIRRVLVGRPRRLLAGRNTLRWPTDVELLPADLRESLSSLADERGVVRDTVARAIEDYASIQRIVAGPSPDADAVFQATLLADAEVALRTIIDAAPNLANVVSIATQQRTDRKTREAAGGAILSMQDCAHALTLAAAAALQWAAVPTKTTLKELHKHATALRIAEISAQATSSSR